MKHLLIVATLSFLPLGLAGQSQAGDAYDADGSNGMIQHPLAPASQARAEQTFAAIDPNLFEEKQGLRQHLGIATKHPDNPLVPRDKPWENRSYDHCMGQVYRDPNSGIYHLWYGVASNIDGRRFGYAYSRDGIRWSKPNLGEVEVNGSTANNLSDSAPLGAFLDPNAAADQRFKRPRAIDGDRTIDRESDPPPRGIHMQTSSDGKRWTDTDESPVALKRGIGDTFNFGWWEPDRRRFVIITRTHTTINGAPVRSVGRLESADFHHWGPLETVFVDSDPGPTRREYYAMPSFRYAGGYVGLLYVFHTKPQPDASGDNWHDIELAWSPDTIHWQQICKGQPLIERGSVGRFDHGRIFGLWAPVELPNELRLYYGGVSIGKHQMALGTAAIGGVGLATFRRDGLVYLEPESKENVIVKTRLLHFRERFLVVNADASHGRIRVGLEDAIGQPIAGFTLEDCDPISSDSATQLASWKHSSNLDALRGQHFRIVMEATNARFYAFRFE